MEAFFLGRHKHSRLPVLLLDIVSSCLTVESRCLEPLLLPQRPCVHVVPSLAEPLIAAKRNTETAADTHTTFVLLDSTPLTEMFNPSLRAPVILKRKPRPMVYRPTIAFVLIIEQAARPKHPGDPSHQRLRWFDAFKRAVSVQGMYYAYMIGYFHRTLVEVSLTRRTQDVNN